MIETTTELSLDIVRAISKRYSKLQYINNRLLHGLYNLSYADGFDVFSDEDEDFLRVTHNLQIFNKDELPDSQLFLEQSILHVQYMDVYKNVNGFISGNANGLTVSSVSFYKANDELLILEKVNHILTSSFPKKEYELLVRDFDRFYNDKKLEMQELESNLTLDDDHFNIDKDGKENWHLFSH